jgi:hypothetical protein
MWLVEDVFSEFRRTLSAIVLTKQLVPTAYSAALVYSALIETLLMVCALLEKKFGSQGREVKSEFRIQDGVRPVAGILNRFD